MLDRETIIEKIRAFDAVHGYSVIGDINPAPIGCIASPHVNGEPVKARIKVIGTATREEFLSQGTESPEQCTMTHFYRVVFLPD